MKAPSWVGIAVLSAVGGLGVGIAATSPRIPSCTPQSYEMTPLQKTQMDLAREHAIEAANVYQQQLAAINALVAQVRTENKWPTTATYNAQTRQFVLPAPPAPPKKR